MFSWDVTTLWETRSRDNIFFNLTVHGRQLGRLKKKKKQANPGSKFRPNYIKVSGGGAQVSVHYKHFQVILMSIQGWEPLGHGGVSPEASNI